ncbi:hypothetical protein [Pseudonocardia alni]|uniref:hypothetical protein n=1 Tax=Pseudonocardia alni TaxID=33907 RepID=UPI00333476CE
MADQRLSAAEKASFWRAVAASERSLSVQLRAHRDRDGSALAAARAREAQAKATHYARQARAERKTR